MPESRFNPADVDRIEVQGSYRIGDTSERYLVIRMPEGMQAVRDPETRTVRVEGVSRSRGGVTMVAHATGNARVMQSGGDMIIGGKAEGASSVEILLPQGSLPDITSV